MAKFLDLPRELRDEIYTHYATKDGGYVYDALTRKLDAADGSRIDLSLMLVCSRVTSELRPVFFSSNTITFKSSWLGHDESDNANCFEYSLERIHQLAGLRLYDVRHDITDEMARRAKAKFPECAEMLQLLREPYHSINNVPAHIKMVHEWQMWHQPPSTHRRFVNFMLLQKKATNKRWWLFWKPEPLLGEMENGKKNIVPQLAELPDPWIIPQRRDLEALEQLGQGLGSFSYEPMRTPIHIKRYTSAAALAIQFLYSVDCELIPHMRHIILDEDNASIAYPECYALGLVSIVQQNEKLTIERRVDIWGNAFTSTKGALRIQDLAQQRHSQNDFDWNRRMSRAKVSGAFVAWSEEAVALAAAGMPPDRFSLAFHCAGGGKRGVVEIARGILEKVIEDAKWQRALEHRSVFPPPGLLFRMPSCYCFFSKMFPHVVRQIQNGQGFVRFDTGDLEISDGPLQLDDDIRPAKIGPLWWTTMVSQKFEPVAPHPMWAQILWRYITS